MRIDSIKYLEETSKGIYCELQYYNFWGTFKIREVFLEKFNNHYFINPTFVKTGNTIHGNFGDAVRREMIREYENTNRNLRQSQ